MRHNLVEMESFDEMVRDWDNSLTDIRQSLNKAVYKDDMLSAYEETPAGLVALQGGMTEQGFRSLCQKIGAPSGWLKGANCPDDLRHTVINRLMRDYEKTCLLRYRNDSVCRGVLSEKYMVYNHLDVWEVVYEMINSTRLGELQPKVWKPNLDDKMSLWILFDKVNADPDENLRTYDGGGSGGLRPAIYIRNAEDGTGKIGLKSGFYRSYCSNGVIFGLQTKASVERIHLGNSQKLVDATIRLAVGEAVDGIGIGIDRYIESCKEELVVGVDEIVAKWSKRHGMSTETSDLWKGFLSRSRTYGDVVMGTSDYAGTLENSDLQEEFETIAGKMLFEEHSHLVERIP